MLHYVAIYLLTWSVSYNRHLLIKICVMLKTVITFFNTLPILNVKLGMFAIFKFYILSALCACYKPLNFSTRYCSIFQNIQIYANKMFCANMKKYMFPTSSWSSISYHHRTQRIAAVEGRRDTRSQSFSTRNNVVLLCRYEYHRWQTCTQTPLKYTHTYLRILSTP